jgi:hypothetical protein
MINVVNPNIVIPPEVIAALDPSVVQTILEDIADAARNHWIGLAGSLTRTRQDYIAGIQAVEMKPGVAVIRLVGVMANLIENGQEAIDMHDTLLGPNVPVVKPGQGPGKREKKDGSGYYRAIPFRHSTPNANGITGQKMGSAYQGVVADAQKLGKEVYKKAKALSGSTSAPGEKTQWGGRLEGGLAPLLKAHHKSDIYQGMVRMEKTYKNATQSSYMTFRMISTGSDGWIRPATQGKNLSDKVAVFIEQLAPQAFEAYVKSLGGTP